MKKMIYCMSHFAEQAKEMGCALNQNQNLLLGMADKMIAKQQYFGLDKGEYPCPCKALIKDHFDIPEGKDREAAIAEYCCPCNEGKQAIKNGESCHCRVFVQEGW